MTTPSKGINQPRQKRTFVSKIIYENHYRLPYGLPCKPFICQSRGNIGADYGTIWSRVEKGAGREKNGFRITVSFVNGKCAWILYIKPDAPIYDSELRTLLDNNAEGSQWNDGNDAPDRFARKRIRYSRADGLANAEYQELGNYRGLSIIAKAWRDVTSAASGL